MGQSPSLITDTSSSSTKVIRISPISLLRIAREHSLAADSKFGGVPSDAELVSIQVKQAGEVGNVFHIFRLRCKTAHPEQLPKGNDGKPCENVYLFNPSKGEAELMREVHRKE